MLTMLGVLLNLGALAYLGFQAASCLGPEQMTGLNFAQNPYILSFVGVVALYFAIK